MWCAGWRNAPERGLLVASHVFTEQFRLLRDASDKLTRDLVHSTTVFPGGRRLHTQVLGAGTTATYVRRIVSLGSYTSFSAFGAGGWWWVL